MAATTRKLKRSLLMTYIDVVPDTEDYELLGEGVVSGKINYNPDVLEETYVSEDSANISVEGYGPTMPVEATCIGGDAVFDFIDSLRVSRAILADAETTLVNVWAY